MGELSPEATATSGDTTALLQLKRGRLRELDLLAVKQGRGVLAQAG